MLDFIGKITSGINKAGDTLMRSSIAKRITAGVVAFSVVLTPVYPTLSVSAEENKETETVIEETVETEVPSETEAEVVDAVIPEETATNDYSEYAAEEPAITESEDVDVTEPTETIDTTAPPVEETEASVETSETETTTEATTTETSATETVPSETEPEVTEEIDNIVRVDDADTYLDAMASMPSGDKLIVQTTDELSVLNADAGIYFDGTYILWFEDADDFDNAVDYVNAEGYKYSEDGDMGVCGNFNSVFSFGAINPNAKVKVAVIDTGSNLANEAYSVLGTDTADYNGHGTAMCNFVLNETSDAYIISIKAIDTNGKGNVSDVYAAVQLADELNCDYILMAISIRDNGDYDAFKTLIEDTKATIVAAAGNNRTNASAYIPAGLDGVISVGAIGNGNVLRSFSNYGTCVDYYEVADSTSEASAKVLGKLIAGKDVMTVAFRNDDSDIYYYKGSELYFETCYTIQNTKVIYVLDEDQLGGATADEFRNGKGSAIGVVSRAAYYANTDRRTLANGCIEFVKQMYNWTLDSDFNTSISSSKDPFLFNSVSSGCTTSMNSVGYSNPASVGITGLRNTEDVDACISDGRALYDYVTANAKPGDILMFGYPADSSTPWHHAAIYQGTGTEMFGGSAQPAIVVYEAPGNGHSGQTRYVSAADLHQWYGDTSKWFSTVVILSIKEGPKTSKLSLTKSSSVPAVTNGNSCYDLNGTTYVLYSDQACTKSVATFKVDSKGATSTTYDATRGTTYYLKETVTGKGYQLDSKTYTVTVASDGTVTVNNGVTVNVSNSISYMQLKDEPGSDPLNIAMRKIDKNGSIVQNATLTGAVFRISYYAQDLGASGNNSATPTVVYEVTLNSNSMSITLPMLQGSTPVGGSNPNYLKNVPSGWDEYPYGTIRIQEIKAPAGYRINDQVLRYRLLDGSQPVYIESASAYGNKNYWKQQQDGSWDLTELPKVGYYSLTKTLDDKNVCTVVSGFKYELYNTSSSSSPVQIATGVSQADGRVLWTYTVPNYYKNTDGSVLLTGTTTYELELPATEKNASGSEVNIQYQVREIKSSMTLYYGGTALPYTYAAPKTNGIAWTSDSDYYYKAVTMANDETTREGVVNDYLYTGLNVNKVVPMGNTFDMTKVKFKVYNTDKNILIANGIVDSNGNVTWHRVHTSGYGTTPNTSTNVLNFLPLGNYRVEETWDKDYLDVNSSLSILIEEKNNNSGWTKTETDTTYTCSYDVNLSDASNNAATLPLAVENERLVQKFNLTKVVTTDGDASTVSFTLYRLEGSAETEIATGTAKTNGIGSYGVTWNYAGKHETISGLDTIQLPVGDYRIVESYPVTYYKNTTVPYTYAVPEGYTAKTENGVTVFYKDFTLAAGSYNSIKSQTVTNVRTQGGFDIVKMERSGDGASKEFTFEVYYRGNEDKAASTSTLIETVKVTTVDGKGSASLSQLPEGWYEIKEVGADSSWAAHWFNDNTVVDGNKVIRLSSDNNMIVDDGVTDNGNAVNGVLIYNDIKPVIRTTLLDTATGTHLVSYGEEVELEDTVSYKNLMPGHYVMSGVLMDKETGNALLDKNGETITGSTEFDVPSVLDKFGFPIPQSGSVEVVFSIDTTQLEGSVIVAFESLHQNSITGTLIAEHNDIDDVDQTVYVPLIHTTLAQEGYVIGDPTTVVSLTDTVFYNNLITGKEYTLTGTLIDKATQEALKDENGNLITATTTFTATETSGTIDVTFTVSSSLLTGKTIVAFESLKHYGITIAIHADINDEAQTEDFPTPSPSPTPPSPLPSTGETSSLSTILGIVSILSAAGLGIVLIIKRKSNHRSE